MERLRNKPEILAPAGSIESLKGAVAAGADAVYIGGSKFGARAYADNPGQDMLLSAIDYIHSKDRRIYLTVNTLMKERELQGELYSFIENYYRAGVDAVIVQDLGVLHFLAQYFPDLPVHASTQMTLVAADGTDFFKGYPVTRLVPARELSLEEIKQLRKETPLEIEAFVHGALCYCYSGQCLFSSMIGGRSGNRGRCAQPCRMPYTVSEDDRTKAVGTYALSPKDLCTLDMIPQLIQAGIDSFKIEGRMKRPEYTAGVTAAYRLLTDLYDNYGEKEFARYLEQHPDILKEQTERVSDLYNRGGFTKGYFVNYHGKNMMSMERPNHSGVKVGTVDQIKGIGVRIRLESKVYPQDVLEIRNGQESYEFTVGRQKAEAGNGFYETNVKKGFPLTKGLPVYRTKNEMLLEELKKNYVEAPVQLPVRARFTARVGEPVMLEVWTNVHQKSSTTPGADETLLRDVYVTVSGDVVSEASNQPVTEDKVKAQLCKTGESAFYFDELIVEMENNCFLPMGKIKELRRMAFEDLEKQILDGYRREAALVGTGRPEKDAAAKTTTCPEDGETTECIALVSTKEQLECVSEDDTVTTVYVDLQNEALTEQISLTCRTKEAGKRAFLVMPHIFRRKEKERYEAVLFELCQAEFDGFLVKSLEELSFLKANGLMEKFEIRLNYNLYAFQSEAKKFFGELGIRRFTAPVELNEEEWKEYRVEDADMILYGRLPLMVSAQCVRDNLFHCSAGKKTEGIVLTDRMEAEFPVRQICSSCYNVIYNSACFSLLGTDLSQFSPAGHRLDFVFETKEQVAAVLKAYRTCCQIESSGVKYTKGHFKRGIE